MAAARQLGRASQLELAGALGVAPSLVVQLADQLEELGAIKRERSVADRRRQSIVLTRTGQKLLDRCVLAAASLGDDLTRGLAAKERALLSTLLGRLLDEALP